MVDKLPSGTTDAPFNIPFVTAVDSPLPDVYTPEMAKRISDLFKQREAQSWIWPTSTERDATVAAGQMTEGSQGYQLDTKTGYIFENGSLRLRTPHGEFNVNVASAPTSAWTNLGNLTSVPDFSSSTSFVTSVGANGGFTIVDPGIYAISIFATINQSSSGVTTLQLSTDSNPNTGSARLSRGNFAVGDDTATLSMANYRVTAANTPLYLAFLNNTGGARALNGRLRVSRIG